MRMPRAIRAMPLTVLLTCVVLTACTAPKAPDEERRPEPQAQPKSSLVDTANAYKDSARAAVAATENAAKREQAKLDAATR